MALPTKYIKEEIQENINTYKAIIDIRGYSIDILEFAELKIIESVMKNLIIYKDGKVKRIKKGVLWRDSRNEYLVEYDNTNTLDLYIKVPSGYNWSKSIDINEMFKKMDKMIEIEEL